MPTSPELVVAEAILGSHADHAFRAAAVGRSLQQIYGRKEA
jgi:hypothetical protein